MFTSDELMAILYVMRRGSQPGMQVAAAEREWEHIYLHRAAVIAKLEAHLAKLAA